MTARRLLKFLGASAALALVATYGLPVNIHAAPQRIAWVSFHSGDNTPTAAAASAGFSQAPDAEYTRLLAAAGHTVTRYVTTASPDTNLLNGFDLVIISRSVPSGHYQTDPSPAMWNGITKPTILLGGYILRASRLGYTTGDTMVDTAGAIRLVTTQPNHAIFTGVPLDANNMMVNPYADRVTHNGVLQAGISVNNNEVTFGGDVIATVGTDTDPTFGGFIIAEYPAGTVMSDVTADTLAAKRLVLLTGSRESGITSEASGIWDLSTDGARLFLNAVHYMTGQPTVEPPPIISNFRPSSGTTLHLAELGLSFTAGSGTAAGIPTTNISLVLNGTNVPADQLIITGTPQARTVSFSNLVEGVQYTGTATALDASGRPATFNFNFDTLLPEALPTSYAYPTSAAVAGSSGMRARVVQATASPTLANTADRAEAQLAGTLIDPATGAPFFNEATPSSDNPDGSYNVGFLNYSVEAGQALERGNFVDPTFPDELFPGGLLHNNNVAIEVLTYLELAPGRYYMGVNSDDGFVVYTGPNARDLFAEDLGRYDGGRGSSDTIFQFRVTEAGLYPFRLVYYQGDGGGNLEWFTMNPVTGEKTLINEPGDANAVKAWRSINVGERPYISSVAPARNQLNTPVSSNIVITIQEPGATVQQNTVQLRVNGQTVTPQFSKVGTTTTVTYDPPQNLPSETTNQVQLTFTDTASSQRTVNYSFVTEFVPPVVGEGANIVWVSFHAADDQPSAAAATAGFTSAPDIEYTKLLTNAGHTVTRYLTTATPDVDYLNGFDLVIISRSNPSANFGTDAATAWHSLTNPTIHLGGYGLRANRSGYYTGDTIPDVSSASVRLSVKDPAHPIFAGVDLDPTTNMVNTYAHRVTYNGTLQAGISVNNNPVAPGGTVLATIGTAGDAAINGTVISEFPAGTTMSNAAADVTAGHRLVFLTGSRESGITGDAAGLYDLDPDGARMFLNAVAYMTGDAPEPPTEITITTSRNASGDLVVSWPEAGSEGYVLQGTDSLSTPNWQAVGGTPTSNGGQLSQAVPTSGTMRFLRLTHP
jgi:hypothetical protein